MTALIVMLMTFCKSLCTVSPVGIGLLSFSSPLFSSPSDSAVTFPLHSLFGNNSTTTVSPCTALLRFLLPHTNTPQLRSETGQEKKWRHVQEWIICSCCSVGAALYRCSYSTNPPSWWRPRRGACWYSEFPDKERKSFILILETLTIWFIQSFR